MAAASRSLCFLAGAVAVQRSIGSPPTPEKQQPKANCDGKFKVGGDHGSDQILIATGWKNEDGFADVLVEKNVLIPQMGGRAYFADTCNAGKYNNTDYQRLNLLGKTMKWSVDLSGAGCGCNAALYLTSMGHNEHVSECFDHYCDANNVCGESCAEIDMMEANQFAYHATLHTATDTDGAASGFGGGGDGWNGPRNWTPKEYGKGGSCIDTAKAFDVAVSFPIDKHGLLTAMQVTLSQKHHSCKLEARVENYPANSMKELTHALLDGMTPIISYWADDNMVWLDGPGDDQNGPCKEDSAKACADSVKFWDFAVEDLDKGEMKQLEKDADKFDKDMAKKHPGKIHGESSGNGDGGDWQQAGTDQWDENGQKVGGDQWDENGQKVGGDQWDENGQKVAGSDEWDGKEGSEQWGGEKKPKEGEEWKTESILMQKDEVHLGKLRGVPTESEGAGLPMLVGVLLGVAGVASLVAAGVVVRRASVSSQSPEGGDAADAATEGAHPPGMGHRSLSMHRLRNSFSSTGDLSAWEHGGAAMLQQPPSAQNLLAMGHNAQAL
jgi:hypothetical protein